MTVRIEAGSIVQMESGRFMRTISIDGTIAAKHEQDVYADTKEELEVIDNENFMKE